MTLRRFTAALFCLALVSPLACKDAAKTEAKPSAEKGSKDDDSAKDGDKKSKKKKAKGDDAVDDDDKGEKAEKGEKGEKKKPADDDAEKKPSKKADGDYDAAMKKARDLMSKKDYKGAIPHYDDACEARDDDALAFGERGYAKVLDKQYDDGLKDLDAAKTKTDDAKLLGPIWYNVGLAKEGKGDKKGALEAYKKSNELRPTKAAASKITALGDTVATRAGGCAAKVDAKVVAAKKYAGWLDLYKALSKKDGVDAPDSPPTSDDAAKKLLCKDGCAGAGPWLARLGGMDSGGGAEVIALVGADGGKLFAWDDVGGGMTFARCGYADEAKLTSGKLARVHVLSEPMELTYSDANGKACSPGDDGCMSGCFSEQWTEIDQFYDLTAQTRVAVVTESGKQNSAGKHKQSVTCSIDADGNVGVSGGGCNQTVKVASSAADTKKKDPTATDDVYERDDGEKCPTGWIAMPGQVCNRPCTADADCVNKKDACTKPVEAGGKSVCTRK